MCSLSKGFLCYSKIRLLPTKCCRYLWIAKRASSCDSKKKEEKGYFAGESWPKNPNKIFTEWLCEATKDQKRTFPIIMCMATAMRTGVPSVRMMTITEYCEQGFVFFTNYCSEKAIALGENPYCGLNVWWEKLNRQVRIQGCASQFSDDLNAKYFEKLSPENKTSTHLRQSTPIKGKKAVIQEIINLQNTYKPPKKIPRSPFWGGYIVRPFMFEFYEHRKDRLHDRVRFRKDNSEIAMDLKPSDRITHRGDAGWVFEWLTP